jgi:predicted Rossmann fold nucleotide-binding protein DprA/Smf involved in DNA uptake
LSANLAAVCEKLVTAMVPNSEISEIEPPADLAQFFRGKPPKLWGVGNSAIIGSRLLGIVSARQTDSDLALKSSQLLRQLASLSLKETAFISGWHSPLEEEALRIVLVQDASLVFCISKSLDRFKPSDEIQRRLSEGNALLLTHCSPRTKRISREASIRRNQLVAGLASVLVVLSAPVGSNSLDLAKSALRHGKRVYAPEHRMNNELFAYGGLPATLDNIRTALGQS